jgi:tetratricopeptide (TPR) repeat protein
MRQAWFVPAAILLFSGLTIGQQPTSPRPQPRVTEEISIRGKVILGNARTGDQLIEVRLERSGGQVLNIAYTDGAGNFEFKNIEAAQYWVAVNADGYEPARESVEVNPTFGRITVTTIFLNKRSPGSGGPGSALDAADPDIIDVSQMKERFPKKAVQNFDKAMEEKQKGQFDKAIKLLEESIQIAPTMYQAHNNLGLLYERVKRYDDAEKEYKTAHQLVAKAAQPLINLGSLYIREAEEQKGEAGEAVGKLLDQALDALEQAVSLNPRSAIAYYYLGSANYKSNFFEEAEAALKKAVDLDRGMSGVHLMLANVYVKQMRWKEVLDCLDTYLKDNPKASDRPTVEKMRDNIAKGLEAANK